MKRNILSLSLLFVLLVACTAPVATSSEAPKVSEVQQNAPVQVAGVAATSSNAQPTSLVTKIEEAPQSAPAASAAEPDPAAAAPVSDESAEPAAPVENQEPAANPQAAPLSVGPEQFPAGVNPLTGLQVEDPALLSLSPALVSVTNFPVTARPQAGLSYSPYVFEMYIGEGMTRFLATFYGSYPQQSQGVSATNDGIGPIRSGRLPYESLRKLYNGFLVMASASPNVAAALGSSVSVFGSDAGDINSALIPATKLQDIAAKNSAKLNVEALGGNVFAGAAPDGGRAANMLYIPYNYLNQVIWRYDAVGGAYLRYQDNADGVTYSQMTDRLNGAPLAYENVVVLFATHHAKAETLIDLDLTHVQRMPALLFRDGKMYEIFWTTANGDFEKQTGLYRPIRFIDAAGNPFTLKPGQTWVQIVQPFTRYNETLDGSYFDMKKKTAEGSGNWVVHFYPPKIEK